MESKISLQVTITLQWEKGGGFRPVDVLHFPMLGVFLWEDITVQRTSKMERKTQLFMQC
jgi:hypothetical protein